MIQLGKQYFSNVIVQKGFESDNFPIKNTSITDQYTNDN